MADSSNEILKIKPTKYLLCTVFREDLSFFFFSPQTLVFQSLFPDVAAVKPSELENSDSGLRI